MLCDLSPLHAEVQVHLFIMKGVLRMCFYIVLSLTSTALCQQFKYFWMYSDDGKSRHTHRSIRNVDSRSVLTSTDWKLLQYNVPFTSLDGMDDLGLLPSEAIEKTITETPLKLQQLIMPKLPLASLHSPQPIIDAQPDVSVVCSNTNVVVKVKRTFYGLSVTADELTLGDSCKSTDILKPYGHLIFNYSLTDCGSKREESASHLLYKFVLHYVPKITQSHFHRAHRINVGIECRFPSRYSHRLAAQPTWNEPSRKIIRSHPLKFQIQLMDTSCSSSAPSNTYLLGQEICIQVSARYLPPGAKLYVTHCYVAPSTSSSEKHTIIDNFGCLRESLRSPYISRFLSPRTDDAIRFAMSAFQFIVDSDAQINLHCKLSVTIDGPGPVHKSCSYSAEHSRWTALTGDDSICNCCESTCVPSEVKTAMYEGSVHSGLVYFSDPSAPINVASPDNLPADEIWFGVKSHGQMEHWNSRGDPVGPHAMPNLKGYGGFPKPLVLEGESDPGLEEVFDSEYVALEKRGPLEVMTKQGFSEGNGFKGRRGSWSVPMQKTGTSEEMSEILTDWKLRLYENSVTPSQKREENEREAGIGGEVQRGLWHETLGGGGLGDYDRLVERGVVGELEWLRHVG